ncbi:hypothetical protein AVEN_221549-1 [Araneus ventricosus]|uniref:Uncharacterized protein n=1 Tax=Araneus ventricosus TaxID=182803 RepID=A0A4Y2RHQ8_ARAVE|nr:hypothetical protein AVEN_221549-1 [Araneus ventricosus]
MSPGPQIIDQVHDNDAASNSTHKSLFHLTPQKPQSANTLNDMSRKKQYRNKGKRGISIFFVDEFKAFHTTKPGSMNCADLVPSNLETDQTNSSIPCVCGDGTFPSRILALWIEAFLDAKSSPEAVKEAL